VRCNGIYSTPTVAYVKRFRAFNALFRYVGASIAARCAWRGALGVAWICCALRVARAPCYWYLLPWQQIRARLDGYTFSRCSSAGGVPPPKTRISTF